MCVCVCVCVCVCSIHTLNFGILFSDFPSVFLSTADSGKTVKRSKVAADDDTVIDEFPTQVKILNLFTCVIVRGVGVCVCVLCVCVYFINVYIYIYIYIYMYV